MRPILLLLVCSSAWSATAMWTGRSEPIITVTGQSAWNCEYDYLGRKIWRIFRTQCPAMIEVQ